MRFVIVTECRSGKSTALKMLEDMGYFCGQSSGAALPKFAEMIAMRIQAESGGSGNRYQRRTGISGLEDT